MCVCVCDAAAVAAAAAPAYRIRDTYMGKQISLVEKRDANLNTMYFYCYFPI